MGTNLTCQCRCVRRQPLSITTGFDWRPENKIGKIFDTNFQLYNFFSLPGKTISCGGGINSVALTKRFEAESYENYGPSGGVQANWIPIIRNLGCPIQWTNNGVFDRVEPNYYQNYLDYYAEAIDLYLQYYSTIIWFYDGEAGLMRGDRLQRWLAHGNRRLYIYTNPSYYGVYALNNLFSYLDVPISIDSPAVFTLAGKYQDVANPQFDYAEVVSNHYSVAGFTKIFTRYSLNIIGGTTLAVYGVDDRPSLAMAEVTGSEIYVSGCIDNMVYYSPQEFYWYNGNYEGSNFFSPPSSIATENIELIRRLICFSFS